jgi:transcriptional regulator with PAS, ATPase and Fis domain
MTAAPTVETGGEVAVYDELLRVLSEALDVRDVFPRVSIIVQRLIAHDRLSVTFHNHEGGREHAASNDDVCFGPLKVDTLDQLTVGMGSLVEDITEQPLPVCDPPDLAQRVIAAGYRAFLGVMLQARERRFMLHLWSKTPKAFSQVDLVTARRIAEHVALALSHEQLAESARVAGEARARAERLEQRVKSLTDELDSKTGYGRVIGESPIWKDVLKKALQVAVTDTTVLLTGESGTGKEVIARFVHRASPRKSGPFIALNCAALPEQLLESELFGYERGAFTGAQQSKPGQIELAAGGVLFLDEIGEMSLSAQAKFLRVLQEREFQRLGGTRVLRADARIIAATNRDLQRAMAQGTFREDLFYRLNVFAIRLPPLRDRRDDVLPLCEAFLDEIGRSFGRPPAGLTHDAREALLTRRWPGNVRELRNALERAAILCEGGLITTAHLPPASSERAIAPSSTDLGAAERATIEQVMREVAGNKSLAAKKLGLSRTQLYVRLRKYQIDLPHPPQA